MLDLLHDWVDMKILFNEPQELALKLEAAPQKKWFASLLLEFQKSSVNTKTILRSKSHYGPLLVQKTLYPEGNDVCHTVILHPPAGIAGGDHLEIQTRHARNTQVVITNPGATKWYKANGLTSSQVIKITLEERAHLDFLPQENIFFDETNACSELQMNLQSTSSMMGWDISQFGRGIAGHTWQNSNYRADIKFYLENRLMWVEANQISSKDLVNLSKCLLDQKRVMGVMWLSSPNASQDLLEKIAEDLPWSNQLRCGATKIALSSEYGIILIRGISDEVEPLKECFIDIWLRYRYAISGIDAKALRLWKT
jgi:urease accessory protein